MKCWHVIGRVVGGPGGAAGGRGAESRGGGAHAATGEAAAGGEGPGRPAGGSKDLAAAPNIRFSHTRYRLLASQPSASFRGAFPARSGNQFAEVWGDPPSPLRGSFNPECVYVQIHVQMKWICLFIRLTLTFEEGWVLYEGEQQ